MTCNTIDDMHLKKTLHEYQQAVEALPPKRRMIYRMVREEGLSHQETARQLNISTNTIERHINEALRTLRHTFHADKLAFILLLMRL
jgi:RNA polymerase sigma-70 factor (ECF subfamily)